MSIFHPLNMQVTAEALAKAASDRLAHGDEWTPWQRHVLGLVAEHAGILVDHAIRSFWDVSPESPPSVDAIREDIVRAFAFLCGTVTEEHLTDGWTEDGDGILDQCLVELGLSAWRIADALATGIRRGTGTVEHEPVHALGPKETKAWLLGHAAAIRATFDTARFRRLDEIADGLFELGNGEEVDADVRSMKLRHDEAVALHAERQWERNVDRIVRVVDATNENFALPAAFAMRYERIEDNDGDPVAIIDWGREPTRHKSSFKRISEEVLTRPWGRHVIPLRIDALGELSPFAVSEIARSGHHVALILGRDAEISANGSRLDAPPAWSRAGAAPVVAEIRRRLREGDKVQVSQAPFREMGAVIGMDLQLDARGSRYVANGETLEETLELKGRMHHATAATCYGMPLANLLEHPVVGLPNVFVEWMEIGDGEAYIGLRSELSRIVPAPEGIEQNPTVAWISNVKDFDEARVYGERRYKDRDANPEDPLDLTAPLMSKRELEDLRS